MHTGIIIPAGFLMQRNAMTVAGAVVSQIKIKLRDSSASIRREEQTGRR